MQMRIILPAFLFDYRRLETERSRDGYQTPSHEAVKLCTVRISVDRNEVIIVEQILDIQLNRQTRSLFSMFRAEKNP